MWEHFPIRQEGRQGFTTESQSRGIRVITHFFSVYLCLCGEPFSLARSPIA